MQNAQTRELLSMTSKDFERLQKFIHEHFGIFLAEHKRGMLTSRLRNVVEKHRLSSYAEYIEVCLTKPSPTVLEELMNAVSTNHTYFNREPLHYEELKRELPALAARAESRQRRKELRAWCAAASYGHEPYTLAMILADHFGSAYSQWDAGLLATDISDEALERARRGVYPHQEVEAMPAKLRNAHLKRLPSGEWEVSADRKREVVFRRFNLMNPLPFKKPFDFVFLRNVMIYFDQDTRRALIDRIAAQTYPGGLLFVGLSEALPRDTRDFEVVGSGIYRRR